jgi:hypothetical protein
VDAARRRQRAELQADVGEGRRSLTVPRVFPIGANLLIEFRLDDRKRTPMEKRVIVRNVSGLYVGASFHPNEMDDPALGFYLMP